MERSGGEDRAFWRGVRIAAGFAALMVVAILIVAVQRDHPLQRDALNPPAVDQADMRAGDNGPLPRAGDVPDNTSGVVRHPGATGSDLSDD